MAQGRLWRCVTVAGCGRHARSAVLDSRGISAPIRQGAQNGVICTLWVCHRQCTAILHLAVLTAMAFAQLGRTLEPVSAPDS